MPDCILNIDWKFWIGDIIIPIDINTPTIAENIDIPFFVLSEKSRINTS